MEHTLVDCLPFHSYLWKVASRCNINCSYCYVYNQGDQTWQHQPHYMSPGTARRAAERMLDHLKRHNKLDANIIFNGGDTMMLVAYLIAALICIFREVFYGRR